MTSFFADLRIAVRGLLKRPGFAMGAILTLWRSFDGLHDAKDVRRMVGK